jgi:hypothetical protein
MNQYQKRAGGVAQVVGFLPYKHEVLSSNPQDQKKKKEQEKRRGGDYKNDRKD